MQTTLRTAPRAGLADFPALISQFNHYRRFGWESRPPTKQTTQTNIYRTEKALQNIEDAYNALTVPMFLRQIAIKTGDAEKTVEKRLVVLMAHGRVKRERAYSEQLNRMIFQWSRV